MRIACRACHIRGGGPPNLTPLEGDAVCDICLTPATFFFECSEAYADRLAERLKDPNSEQSIWQQFNAQTIALHEQRAAHEKKVKELEGAVAEAERRAAGFESRKRKAHLATAIVTTAELREVATGGRMTEKFVRLRAMWEVPPEEADLVRCGVRFPEGKAAE